MRLSSCPGLMSAALVLALSAAGTSAIAAPVAVTSPKIIIQNVEGGLQIPLATSGPEATVQFTSEGDIQVNCRLTEDACPNLNLGGGFGVGPTIDSFAFSPTSVTSGASSTVSWNSADAEACYAVGPTGVANWTGRSLGKSGNQSLAFANATEEDLVVELTLRCFKETGATEATASLTVTPGTGSGEPALGFCTGAEGYYNGSTRPVPTEPAFTGWGMTRTNVEFSAIWPGVAVGGTGTRRGIPGAYAPTGINDYMSIPFSMTTDTDPVLGNFTLDWSEGSSIVGVIGGSITVTISPCPGDFRTRVTGAVNDDYLRKSCAVASNSFGQLQITSIPGTPGCYAPKGKVMYINISTSNVTGTSAPTATSCPTAADCGVNIQVN